MGDGLGVAEYVLLRVAVNTQVAPTTGSSVPLGLLAVDEVGHLSRRGQGRQLDDERADGAAADVVGRDCALHGREAGGCGGIGLTDDRRGKCGGIGRRQRELERTVGVALHRRRQDLTAPIDDLHVEAGDAATDRVAHHAAQRHQVAACGEDQVERLIGGGRHRCYRGRQIAVREGNVNGVALAGKRRRNGQVVRARRRVDARLVHLRRSPENA